MRSLQSHSTSTTHTLPPKAPLAFFGVLAMNENPNFVPLENLAIRPKQGRCIVSRDGHIVANAFSMLVADLTAGALDVSPSLPVGSPSRFAVQDALAKPNLAGHIRDNPPRLSSTYSQPNLAKHRTLGEKPCHHVSVNSWTYLLLRVLSTQQSRVMQTTYTRDDYPFYGLKPVSRLSDLDRARQDARLINEYLRQVAGPYVLPYRISTDVNPNAAFATHQSDNGDASNRRSSVGCSASQVGSQAVFSASLKAHSSVGGMPVVASETPELDNVLRFLYDDNQIFARGFSNMTTGKNGRISTHNPHELSNEQQRIHFMALPNTLCEVVAPSDCFADSDSAQDDESDIVFGFMEVVLRDTDILARWADVLDDDESEEGWHHSAGRARRDTVSTVASTIWSDADAEEVYATPATSACASPVDEPKEL
ncbi:hypothetical protein HMN09_00349200 [Mycena chlorophos]|uniref:Uncharacterized protein n=1 Tax=Mycena chlorophos TaxID=658473 RepID=A0A8H6TMI7_MYCCL|nr:hypothetical protein HMN09_00349200 [Mycena chlorophos]